MSNSNFNITKVVVDPVSQEISSLEVNGKPIETGGEVNLEKRVYDSDNKLFVNDLFEGKISPVHIYPSVGYDGLESVTIQPDGLTGYPSFDPSELSFEYTGSQPVGMNMLYRHTIPSFFSTALSVYVIVKYTYEGDTEPTALGYINIEYYAEEP